MNEIVIDHKKYVSTKQAAEMTGYAKDYVGQLCREGRVPAQLIGRSWYVLESALQDHRFGAPEEKQKQAAPVQADEPPKIADTWATPRYEAEVPYFPSINKLAAPKEEKRVLNMLEMSEQERNEERSGIEAMHSAWKEWFSTQKGQPEAQEAVAAEAVGPVEAAQEKVIEDADEVVVPIHALETPVRELKPKPLSAIEALPAEEDEEMEEAAERTLSASGAFGFRLALIAVAFFAVSIAVFGSGLADSFISDIPVASNLGGINTVNK